MPISPCRSSHSAHRSPDWPPTGWTGPHPASASRCWRRGTGTPQPGPAGRRAPPAAGPPWSRCCHCGSWRSTRSCWAGWSQRDTQRRPARRGWWWRPRQSAGPGPSSPPGCKVRLRGGGARERHTHTVCWCLEKNYSVVLSWNAQMKWSHLMFLSLLQISMFYSLNI